METRAFIAALAGACLLACAGGRPQRANETPARVERLGKHDRARLAWLESERRATASLLIAYPPLRGDQLLRRLSALGGRARYQSDTLGYLRIDIPIGRVQAASALPGIDAMNLNGTQEIGRAHV